MVPHWHMEADLTAVRSDGLRIRSKRGGVSYTLESPDGRPIGKEGSPGLVLFLAAVHEARSVPLGPDRFDWARRRRAILDLKHACGI